MTRDSRSLRTLEALLRAGRSVVLLVALLAFLGLTSAPHHHAGSTEERSCPVCQVTRGDGAAPPESAPADHLRCLEGTLVPSWFASCDVSELRTHGAPLPSRGPPPVSPAEQP